MRAMVQARIMSIGMVSCVCCRLKVQSREGVLQYHGDCCGSRGERVEFCMIKVDNNLIDANNTCACIKQSESNG